VKTAGQFHCPDGHGKPFHTLECALILTDVPGIVLLGISVVAARTVWLL
jgi:hypothetical protein